MESVRAAPSLPSGELGTRAGRIPSGLSKARVSPGNKSTSQHCSLPSIGMHRSGKIRPDVGARIPRCRESHGITFRVPGQAQRTAIGDVEQSCPAFIVRGRFPRGAGHSANRPTEGSETLPGPQRSQFLEWVIRCTGRSSRAEPAFNLCYTAAPNYKLRHPRSPCPLPRVGTPQGVKGATG